MMTFSRKHRCGRRGLSLVEVLAASVIGLIIVGVTTAFNGAIGKVFLGCVGGSGAQQEAERALQIMAQDIRASRGLTAGTNLSANPPTLVLQMPAYNADGSLVVPLRSGNTITYAISGNGRRLLRTESGVGTRDVAAVDDYGSLAFTIGYTTSDSNGNGIIEQNEYVTLIPSLSVTNRITSGSSVYDRSFSSSEEIGLRNR